MFDPSNTGQKCEKLNVGKSSPLRPTKRTLLIHEWLAMIVGELLFYARSLSNALQIDNRSWGDCFW